MKILKRWRFKGAPWKVAILTKMAIWLAKFLLRCWQGSLEKWGFDENGEFAYNNSKMANVTTNRLSVGENSNLTQKRCRCCVHFWISDLQMVGGRSSHSIHKSPSASVPGEYVEFWGWRIISLFPLIFMKYGPLYAFLAKYFGTSMMSCREIAMFPLVCKKILYDNAYNASHFIRNAK